MDFLTEKEKELLKEGIFRRLKDPSFPFAAKERSGRWRRIGIAAATMGILFIPLYFSNHPVKTNVLLVESADADERKEIMLSDSSVVILNANSSIKYNKDFSGDLRREVYLEGNAFFIVKKEKTPKQFIVHTHSLSVTVLGTQFNVNARSGAAEVALTLGKVKVSRKDTETNSAYLDPGEKLKLDTLHNVFVKRKLNANLYSAWTKGTWIFEQTTLQEIAELLKAYYGVDIIFKSPKYRYLKMSAVIPVSNLQNLLPVINETLGLSIKQSDNKLFIQ